MEASIFLREKINAAIPKKFKNISALAEFAGISQSHLSEFIRGNRQNLTLETAWKILDVLGLEIRDKGEKVLAELQQAPEQLSIMPVFAVAGAGPAFDDEAAEPFFHIAVPRAYAGGNITTLLISGDSMSPTILDHAVVGVNREKADVVQGKIYAVRLPYEGIVVKRLFLDHVKKCFILRSDNKTGNYPDIEIPFAETDGVIYGRVDWVLQSFKQLSF